MEGLKQDEVYLYGCWKEADLQVQARMPDISCFLCDVGVTDNDDGDNMNSKLR